MITQLLLFHRDKTSSAVLFQIRGEPFVPTRLRSECTQSLGRLVRDASFSLNTCNSSSRLILLILSVIGLNVTSSDRRFEVLALL